MEKKNRSEVKLHGPIHFYMSKLCGFIHSIWHMAYVMFIISWHQCIMLFYYHGQV
jgi:hypothetical protein